MMNCSKTNREQWHSQKVVMWTQGMAQRREGLLFLSYESTDWEFLILSSSCKEAGAWVSLAKLKKPACI